ncbi:hypothetical protein C8J57DRAFT_1533115 [Mycena rebaudengoi]|nr:hypothetical protein C8J57DRAFT_1533115 [Mycena rebaudengoi]
MANLSPDRDPPSLAAKTSTLNFFGSPATPLTLRSQNDASDLSSAPDSEGAGSGRVPPHEQSSLTKAQSDGLKAVAGTLIANHGGLASDAAFPAKAPPPQNPAGGTAPDLSDMGPASTTRSVTVTRSKSSPNVLTTAPAPIAAAFIAQTDTTRTSPYTTPPVSAAFTRLGLKVYTATDNKKETAAPMAIRAATNIQILAGVIHAVETNVADLARDLKNLKIEVQLAPGTAPKEPSPPSSTQEEDNDDVLSRLDELETRTDNLRDYNVETSAALAAIKHTAPPMVVAEQLSSGLHASLIGRFDAITRDRDILDSNTQYLATKHAKADARQSTAIDELRAENADLRAKLCAIEATVAQLSFAPPVPIRSHSR